MVIMLSSYVHLKTINPFQAMVPATDGAASNDDLKVKNSLYFISTLHCQNYGLKSFNHDILLGINYSLQFNIH